MGKAVRRPRWDNVGEMLRDLGVPAERVYVRVPPGRATEADWLRLAAGDRLYELIDGVIVEKAVGVAESLLAGWILTLINNHARPRKLGAAFGPDVYFRLFPGVVRAPDVTFVRWELFPDGKVPSAPLIDGHPDLAVEVLSPSNRAGEMKRKLKEFFLAGANLVWLVNPARRTVTVHEAPDARRVLTEADTLDGGAVLPGFAVPVAEIFADLAPAQPGRRKKS